MSKSKTFFKNFKDNIESKLWNGAGWQPASIRCKVVADNYLGWRQIILSAHRKAIKSKALSPKTQKKLLGEIADGYVYVAKICAEHGRRDLAAMFLNDSDGLIFKYANVRWLRLLCRMNNLKRLPQDTMLLGFESRVIRDVMAGQCWVNGEEGSKAVERNFSAWLENLTQNKARLMQQPRNGFTKQYLAKLAAEYCYLARLSQYYGHYDLARLFLNAGSDVITKYGSHNCKQVCFLITQLQKGC